jgi:hypothetical protein
VRLHLVALPHTRVSRDFATCAYTQKALKFSKMMAAVGHEVVLYAPEGSDESYCELVPCLSETERVATFGWDDPNRLPFWPTDEQFSRFNVRGGVSPARAVRARRPRPARVGLVACGRSPKLSRTRCAASRSSATRGS